MNSKLLSTELLSKPIFENRVAIASSTFFFSSAGDSGVGVVPAVPERGVAVVLIGVTVLVGSARSKYVMNIKPTKSFCRSEGYYRYHTLQDVYFVPNYGNLVVFQPLQAGSGILSKVIQEGKGTTGRDVFKNIVDSFRAEVNAWNNREESEAIAGGRSPVLDIPYDLKVAMESELSPPVILNQREKILTYLDNMLTRITTLGSAPGLTSLESYYQRLLFDFYQEFRTPFQTAKQSMEDITFMGEYGFRLDNGRRLETPSFIKNFLFPIASGGTTSSNPAQRLVKVENKKNLLLSSESTRLAESLMSWSVGGRRSWLLNDIKRILTEFMDDDALRVEISDRYRVDAAQLEARKQLRQYGVSFLNNLGSSLRIPLDWKSVLSAQELQASWNTNKLREMFTEASTYLQSLDPQIRKALATRLKVEIPSDHSTHSIRHFQGCRGLEF